ncbi:hypothetical protein FA15DRAFT_711027 [Coprinopsis marcescibilis]|uniref:Integrase core domain-containing protein n=1 Tax=Coprinopsis marcescibilis TaxID=230819 RepID=A0A5C3KAW0_COPMA|nr:hypothetical protein FA15DRAFT_711027 [Coprinopsis marcescibilis]
MPNPSGKNQWGSKEYPPDEQLREGLLKCVRLKYTRKSKIKFLKDEFGLSIGETTLCVLEDRLEIPTVRKPRLPKDTIRNTAAGFIQKDITHGTGPHALKSMLQDEHIMIARDTLRLLMKEVAPEGFDLRRPGANRTLIPRLPLLSLGPYQEVSADGHEKLNSQALQMGDISIPIYAYRDKWSGYIIKLVAIPDSRSAAPLAHLYLDLVAECGGIPLQLTTDKGPERGWQQSIQDALRRIFAPDVDPAVFATAMAIMSVHNTVIESLWRWLGVKVGRSLKEIILQGKARHIFQPQCTYHSDLFYWIFIPLIQDSLDSFRTYWNHHRIRTQAYKHMPSGHVPADAINLPEKYDPNALNCLIRVPEDAQRHTRRLIEEEVGPRDTFFRWFSDDFKVMAEAAFISIGRPSATLENAWEVFSTMSDAIKVILG